MANDDTLSFPPNPDFYLRLGFIRNPDGSFTRPELPPELTTITPVSSFINTPVVAKDITINPSNNLWIRIFIPRQEFQSHHTPQPKLPLILYFVGGGFVYRQANLTMHEDFYKKFTVNTRSVFISISYRLAPEHRLPAPYDDAVEVLDWIKNTPDDWISKFADTSNTWLVGASAGANIVYRVGLHLAASAEQDLNKPPINIKGLILSQPYFGGIQRTESEIRFGDDEIAALWITDIMWDLALPVGADRDNEYCNPMTGVKLKPAQFDGIKALGWKILIMTQTGDPLSDRGIELFNILKEKGVDVVGKFEEGGSHANYSPLLYKAIIDFVTSSSMAA